jgi:hypothetical protein
MYSLGRELLYGRALEDMRRGCLFWLLVSVVLSVTLTVLVNLVLFALSGWPGKQRADDTLGQGQEPRPGMLHSRAHRVPV